MTTQRQTCDVCYGAAQAAIDTIRSDPGLLALLAAANTPIERFTNCEAGFPEARIYLVAKLSRAERRPFQEALNRAGRQRIRGTGVWPTVDQLTVGKCRLTYLPRYGEVAIGLEPAP